MGYTVVKNAPGVTPGGYTVSKGDANATNAGTAAGTEGSPYVDDVIKAMFDKFGLRFAVGLGSDGLTTFLEMTCSNGGQTTPVFIYLNAGGTAFTFSTTKP